MIRAYRTYMKYVRTGTGICTMNGTAFRTFELCPRLSEDVRTEMSCTWSADTSVVSTLIRIRAGNKIRNDDVLPDQCGRWRVGGQRASSDSTISTVWRRPWTSEQACEDAKYGRFKVSHSLPYAAVMTIVLMAVELCTHRNYAWIIDDDNVWWTTIGLQPRTCMSTEYPWYWFSCV